MNNTDWKILIYLREERSINKVAKRLFMTQPSLTYRLDQMEKEIGVPLFIRTNKGVHFTDAGNRLFSYAEKELQRYQDMKNFVTHEPNTVSGVLRIGASRSFTQSHMPTLLKGFVDRYSDIELSLTTMASDQLTKLVKKEDIQLAIIRGNQEWPEMDILLANPLMYLISAKPIDYKTLTTQPTIRYRPTRDWMRRAPVGGGRTWAIRRSSCWPWTTASPVWSWSMQGSVIRSSPATCCQSAVRRYTGRSSATRTAARCTAPSI